MRCEVVARRFITCLCCGEGSWPVEHLQPGRAWGPWSCPNRDCAAAVRGTALDDGAIDVEVSDKSKRFLCRLVHHCFPGVCL